MSASLVGSEMCIRDRFGEQVFRRPAGPSSEGCGGSGKAPGVLLACSWRAPGELLASSWRAPGELLACSWRAPG
eukprot:14937103-Alexandrium_andersonii.AAC.1